MFPFSTETPCLYPLSTPSPVSWQVLSFSLPSVTCPIYRTFLSKIWLWTVRKRSFKNINIRSFLGDFFVTCISDWSFNELQVQHNNGFLFVELSHRSHVIKKTTPVPYIVYHCYLLVICGVAGLTLKNKTKQDKNFAENFSNYNYY